MHYLFLLRNRVSRADALLACGMAIFGAAACSGKTQSELGSSSSGNPTDASTVPTMDSGSGGSGISKTDGDSGDTVTTAPTADADALPDPALATDSGTRDAAPAPVA